MTNAEYIWNYFYDRIGNEYGIAGLIGNLYAESGLCPYIVQGDVPVSEYSEQYTADVDRGVISEYDFVHNGPGGGGYGLCQWTYYTRKQALYDRYIAGEYPSIGDLDLACDYLWYELKHDFKTVLEVLKSATSVREASDSVLHDFESPADQSTAVEEYRESLGIGYYEQFAGTGGGGSEESDNYKIIQSAIEWAVSIANDDSHGYDQNDRWGLDYDCSSLIIQAYEQAGCPVKTNGATHTGNMEEVFTETGFESIGYNSGMALLPGDVLLREGHTAMYIGDGKIVSAHINELGETTGGATGDQTGEEIDVSSFASSGEWVRVLRLPADHTQGDTAGTRRKLSKLLLYAVATDIF